MKRAPIRGGEVSLLIASGILVVYGAIMTVFTILGALYVGIVYASYDLGGPTPFFNIMWLFVAVNLLYVALGLTLHGGFRPIYFLTIVVVTVMLLYHGASLAVISDPVVRTLAAAVIAVNFAILLFVAFGYREVESRTVREPFWRMLRDRRSQKEIVCLNCGSHSIQEVRPGEGYCNFCGKMVSFPVGG
jgi:hypothetical protein